MKEINHAYEILKTPESRTEYDQVLQMRRKKNKIMVQMQLRRQRVVPLSNPHIPISILTTQMFLLKKPAIRQDLNQSLRILVLLLRKAMYL